MGSMVGGIGDAIRIARLQREMQDYQAANVAVPSGFQPTPISDQAYTAANRPGYQEFGPSGQFQQPIYQSSYQNYVQPTSFYSPGYDVPALYNPFVMNTAPTQATQGEAPASTGEGMAYGGPVQSQGIDALLR